MRRLSIIVVAFNERKHISRLKASFDALVLDDDVEVETLLVDGAARMERWNTPMRWASPG